MFQRHLQLNVSKTHSFSPRKRRRRKKREGKGKEEKRKREGGRRGEGGGKAERIHAFYIQMAPKKSLPSTLTLKHC